MSDKEEDLRKRTRANLDPKGWEALLEGVPRVDDGADRDTPHTPPEEANPRAETSLPKESARSAEEGSPSLPHNTETADGQPSGSEPLPAETTGTDASADLPVPESCPVDESSAEDRDAPGEKRMGKTERLIHRLMDQPLLQRGLQYYRELTQRDQRILLAGVFFVTAVFFYSTILSPLLEQDTLINRKIAKKQSELTEMLRLRSSAIRDRRGMNRVKKILEKRGRGFSVFAYLEELAGKAKIKDRIVYMKPRRETPVGPFRESLVEIKLDKIALPGLTRFLYQIESSENLLYIKNLKIKSGKYGKENGMDVTLSVGTLVMNK